MIDSVKILTDCPELIGRLHNFSKKNLKQTKPPNNNYTCYALNEKLKLSFRKVIMEGQIIGFRHVEVYFNPHYHKNDYLHNGNDLTPLEAIQNIKIILSKIGINSNDYKEFKVVNLEFGVNFLLPNINVQNFLNGVSFYKRTSFKSLHHGNFKITDATKYKQIKIYGKGNQFSNHPEYNIPLNTVRFEVKSKQTRNIKKYGIITISELVKLETYDKLAQELINEQLRILILNPNSKRVDNRLNYWEEILNNHRSKFLREKKKYNHQNQKSKNLNHLFHIALIDKLNNLLSATNSTQKPPLNKGKTCFEARSEKTINVENVAICPITGICLNHEKKNSKYIKVSTLKMLKEWNYPKYLELKNDLLPKTGRVPKFEKSEIQHMAKQIRNRYYNNKSLKRRI